MIRFLLMLALLLSFNSYAQIDQKKLDSLSRFIDSSAKARRSLQDSVIRFQDSTFHSEVNKALHQSAADSVQLVQKRKEAEQRQQTGVRIIVGILLLVLLMAIARRRKTKT